MPKIRGIKPETWTDDKFVRLSPLARLLFIGMWNLACDNGHVEDNLVQLKIRLLPMDSCDVGPLVDEMIETGQVERHDGYLKVIKLPEHQKIDLYWLTLCEWCEQDEHKAFTPLDKKARKKGASPSPDGDKSGDSLVPVSDMRGGDVRGGDVRGAGKPPAKRATQLPDTWEPNPGHHSIAAERQIDIGEEVAKFRDWATSKGEAKKDWDAAFRNWLRNARPSARRPATERPSWGREPAPAPPGELIDDPEGYAKWVEDWNAGRPVPTSDGTMRRRSA